MARLALAAGCLLQKKSRYYSQLELGQPHPAAIQLLNFLTHQLQSGRAGNGVEAWNAAESKGAGQLTAQEMITAALWGIQIRDIPLQQAIKTGLKKVRCYIPGLDISLNQDNFFCKQAATTSGWSSIFADTIYNHGKYRPLKAAHMRTGLCLWHYVAEYVASMFAGVWAQSVSSKSSERRHQNGLLAPPIDVEGICNLELPIQPGI